MDDFHIVDVKEEFKDKIIKYFIETYKSEKLQIHAFYVIDILNLEKAIEISKKIGADYISSGHYIIREYSRNYRTEVLKKGVDNYKDQSYFLSYIKKDIISIFFSLWEKCISRKLEKWHNLGLSVADKKIVKNFVLFRIMIIEDF